MEQEKTGSFSDYIREQLSHLVSEVREERGDVIVTTTAEHSKLLLESCKSDDHLMFGMLVDLTAVDWMDDRSARFEVVYQLLSIENKRRLTVSVPLSEDSPAIDSVVELWRGANFMEREVWDMFGITFQGHPDLRRVLLYDEFVGHPLRKDYPIQGKQPRVPLRYPEVENTARNMHRPELVTIRSRKSGEGKEATSAEVN